MAPGALRTALDETLAKEGLALLAKSESGGGDTGKKFDQSKSRMDLLAPEAMFAMGDVLAYGVNKYDKVNKSYNWRYGMEWHRPFAAALRHMFAWFRGERLDPESGLPHLAHAAVNLMFLITYEATGTGTDDRWKAGK